VLFRSSVGLVLIFCGLVVLLLVRG
jgi:hypothetical protein